MAASLNARSLLRLSLALGAVGFLAACAFSGREGDSHAAVAPVPRALESPALTAEASNVSTERHSLAFSVSYRAPDAVRVPMKLENGVPKIPCRVNGHEVWMMLDTGSQACILEAATARQCGVRTVAPSVAEAAVHGVAGMEAALVGVPDSMSVGNWQWNHLPCLIRTQRSAIPGPWIFSRQPVSFNLLGMDAIKSMCSYVCLDYRRGEAVFGFKAGPSAAAASAGSRSLEFRGGLPFIPLQAGRSEWWALLDTGSAVQLEIDPGIARLPGLSQRTELAGLVRTGIGGSGSSAWGKQVKHFALPHLTILGREWRNVEVLILGDQAKVGSGLLKHSRLTLDLKHSRAWLE